MSLPEILFGWLHQIEGNDGQILAASVVALDWKQSLDRLQIVPVRSGGFSGARIWKVSCGQGTDWCLRKWPADGPSQDRLVWIHSRIFAAAGRGVSFLSVPVPALPFQKTVTDMEGHFWELSPWLPGEPVLNAGYDSAAMKLAIGAAIELHSALDAGNRTAAHSHSARASSPAIERRLNRLNQVGRLLEQIRAGLDGGNPRIDRGLVSDSMNAIESWTERLVLMANKIVIRKFRLQPVLSDLWSEHVLFENGSVSGVIDYGSLCMDILELPFARLVGSVVMQSGSRSIECGGESEGHDVWRELQGLGIDSSARMCLDPEIMDFLHKTNVFLGCLNWLEWIFVQHREFADTGRAEDRTRQMMNAANALAAGD